jgi:hypothetical protein
MMGGLGSKKRAKSRRYPVNRIKQSCSYDQNEIAKLFGIDRNTVRHWIRRGFGPSTIAVRSSCTGQRSKVSWTPVSKHGGINARPASSFASDVGRLASLGGTSQTRRPTLKRSRN